MEVIDQRRVVRMVECVVHDPSADARPFDLMNKKFADATDYEFVEACNRVFLLLRELVRLDEIDRAHVTPKAETPPRRRRARLAPKPMPLDDPLKALGGRSNLRTSF